MSDWRLAAWSVDRVAMLGIPQSGPGSNHVECKQLARVDGQRTQPERAAETAMEGGGGLCGGADDTGQGVGCLSREMEG